VYLKREISGKYFVGEKDQEEIDWPINKRIKHMYIFYFEQGDYLSRVNYGKIMSKHSERRCVYV
jgi:hypothetical protein